MGRGRYRGVEKGSICGPVVDCSKYSASCDAKHGALPREYSFYVRACYRRRLMQLSSNAPRPPADVTPFIGTLGRLTSGSPGQALCGLAESDRSVLVRLSTPWTHNTYQSRPLVIAIDKVCYFLWSAGTRMYLSASASNACTDGTTSTARCRLKSGRGIGRKALLSGAVLRERARQSHPSTLLMCGGRVYFARERRLG